MFHSKVYDFKYRQDYEFMTISTLGIAISITMTLVYITFYSISEELFQLLNMLDYGARLIMIFFYTLAFIASDLAT